MRVVVTGGAGFIGANFAHQLLREHPPAPRPINSVPNLTKIQATGFIPDVQDLRLRENMAAMTRQ